MLDYCECCGDELVASSSILAGCLICVYVCMIEVNVMLQLYTVYRVSRAFYSAICSSYYSINFTYLLYNRTKLTYVCKLCCLPFREKRQRGSVASDYHNVSV